jgi:hypothetical protein
MCGCWRDGLVDAQDESERLETLFLAALRHIVNLEAGSTGPTPEREAPEALARAHRRSRGCPSGNKEKCPLVAEGVKMWLT